MINIKRLILPSELRLDYSPTKFQSDWMCGIYSCMSAYLSYHIRMSVYPDVCLCIALPFTSNLGGSDIKGIVHNSSTKPRASPRFTLYTMVYYMTPERRY